MRKSLTYLSLAVLLLTGYFFGCKKQENNYTPPTTSSGGGGGTGGGGGGYGGGQDTGNTSIPVTQIYIFNYHYSPTNTSVVKGSSVSWTNRDSISHTVTSRDGVFESGDIGPGKNYFLTFTKEGYYSYYCKYHKEGGTIIVH